jgi:hypothetical protein
MAVDRTHDDRNAHERARLAALATRADADLARDLGGGWTIATALAHVAFWDRLGVERWRAWERTGQLPAPLQIEIDMLNAALVPGWQALTPRAALEEAIAAAEAIDQLVRELPDQTVEAYRAAVGGGFPTLLERSRHRREHADQIERALS